MRDDIENTKQKINLIVNSRKNIELSIRHNDLSLCRHFKCIF